MEEKPLFHVLLRQGEKRWYLLGRPGQVNVLFVLGFFKDKICSTFVCQWESWGYREHLTTEKREGTPTGTTSSTLCPVVGQQMHTGPGC